MGFSRKNVRMRGQAEKNNQKLSVIVYSVFHAFFISRDPARAQMLSMLALGKL